MKLMDSASVKQAKLEAEIWAKLGTHMNIIRYVASQIVKNPKEQS